MANEYSADVPKGFNIPKQVRLDSITGIQNELTLKNLGSGNNLAFKYYEGLKIYCKDEKTEYIWREVIGVETGLLNAHFVYPTYTAVDGIDYSGKSFNFFLVSNSNITPPNGSETKINAGINTTVTGLGTIASPYIINSTDTVANGSETKINEGTNITVMGIGTILDPYIINADLTDLGIVKTIDNEVIAPGQTLSIINNELTGKVLTTKEYVQSIIPTAVDGSETKINAGNNVTITGTGTTLTPYIINSLTQNTPTYINSGTDIEVVGVGSIDNPYIINSTNSQLDTKVEFNERLTDGDFLFVGDVTQYTDELVRDVIGASLVDTDTIDFIYNDGLNTISAEVKPNSIEAIQLANNINVSEFINDANYATNSNLALKENTSNKQDSLTIDGSGIKFPTVDAVNTELDNIKSQINPNTYVVTDNGSSLVGNDFTLNSGWSWKINNIDNTNASPVIINVPLAASGFQRIDLIVLNASNTAIRVVGVEVAGTAASPVLPLNTILVASIFSDSTTHTPVIPKPKNQVSQFLRNGETRYSPSEDVVYDALATKENVSNKSDSYTTSSSTTYASTKAVVDGLASIASTDYATVVYFNDTNPSTATIFDDENPPTVNDPLLEDDTDNLYIGTDSSTWVYNGSIYVTEAVPETSNFYFSGTTISAGVDKSSAIYRAGAIQSGSFLNSNTGVVINKNGSNTVNSGGRFAFYNTGYTEANMFQLNASNGVDLWNYASSTWNKRMTFSSGGDLTANSFIKNGGTGSQYLMADGSTTTGASGGGARVYNVKDYGALGDGATDDTAAIQTTINAVFAAGGGVVYFPNGVYIIGGSLITSLDGVNPNCQLYIPLTDESVVGTAPTIKFLGETPPNFNVSGLVTWAENFNSVVLKSTITGSGTNPSVIGSSYDTTTFGDFNYTQLEIENLIICVKSKSGATHIAPTVGGINAGYIELFSATNLRIDSESENYLSASPTNVITGIIMPYINNNAWSYLNRVSIENMNIGIRVSEHTNGQNVAIWNCVKGLNIESSTHLSSFDHLLIVWCNYNIYVPASLSPLPVLKINNLVIEDYNNSFGAKWYANVNDIYDLDDQLRGEVKYIKVISSVGKTPDLSIIGAKNFNKYNLYRQGERYEVFGSQAVASTTGLGLAGLPNLSIVEINSNVPSSTDDAFSNLYLTHTQSGTSTLVGRVAFINLASTISDKRLAQIYATTNGSKEAGKLYITANNGTSMQVVAEIEGERIILGKPLKLKNYTVSTLPTGTQGDTAYCTDLLTPVYMATAVGGGTVVWKVFHDGTGWKVD